MKKTIITLLLLALALSAAAQKIDPKKVYQILTPDGLAIDNQASLSIETHMFLAVPDNDSPAQAWQFRPLGDGNYQLVNGFSFQALVNILSSSGRTRNRTRTSTGPSNSPRMGPAR